MPEGVEIRFRVHFGAQVGTIFSPGSFPGMASDDIPAVYIEEIHARLDDALNTLVESGAVADVADPDKFVARLAESHFVELSVKGGLILSKEKISDILDARLREMAHNDNFPTRDDRLH